MTKITDIYTVAGATNDETLTYRYSLTREWESAYHATANFVMLNPSTASATADDPTIRRCVAFARAWGCHRLVVTNLYALRATDPAQLRHHQDPIGPDNDRHIHVNAFDAGIIVCAWGSGAMRPGGFTDRAREVYGILRSTGITILALGTTKGGMPRHPLYLPAAASPLPYAIPGA